MEMQWYTLYTKPKQEKRVTAILKRKKIVHFCPTASITKKESKSKNYESFNCYLFVRVQESQIAEVKQIRGIKNFMYWMNRPATITTSEINLIKNFLEEYPKVMMEKKEVGFDLNYNYVNSQRENEGKLIHMNDNKVKIAIPSLGYIMIADVKKSPVPLEATKAHLHFPALKTRYLLAK